MKRDRFEEIKCILDAPGEVFFGSLSEGGVVSQDVCDAEPYFKWLIDEVERMRDEVEKHKSRENELMGVLDQIDQKTFDRALEQFHSKVGDKNA